MNEWPITCPYKAAVTSARAMMTQMSRRRFCEPDGKNPLRLSDSPMGDRPSPLIVLPSLLLLLCQGVFQVLAGHCVIRFDPDGLLKMPDGLLRASFQQERAAQVIVGFRVIRGDSHGLPELLNGIIHTPLLDQDDACIVMELGIVGLLLQGFEIVCQGFIV